jgi:hypothetical protein
MLAGAFFPALLFFIATWPAFDARGYGNVSWLEAVIRHLDDPLMFASAMVPGGLVGGLILYSGARRKNAVVPPGL